jgi:hypothetical protein
MRVQASIHQCDEPAKLVKVRLKTTVSPNVDKMLGTGHNRAAS